MRIETIDYSALPDHTRGSMKLYIEHGIQPGGFLMAVLSNKLVESAGRADSINIQHLATYASWLYNEAPHNAWGSPEAVYAWINKHQERG